MFEDTDIDIVFWIKFSICTFLFAILPVWIFTFVELSFGYKVMFTFVGAIGVFIALSGKSMRLHK
jgi:hypothetical protein